MRDSNGRKKTRQTTLKLSWIKCWLMILVTCVYIMKYARKMETIYVLYVHARGKLKHDISLN